jgi:hypothetical protein
MPRVYHRINLIDTISAVLPARPAVAPYHVPQKFLIFFFSTAALVL